MHPSVQHKSFGTHDGSFHADEVTACSLLLLFGLIDRDKVFRSREQEILDRCEYVCDVGGIYDPQIKRFDHHQVDFKGSLSSAGMILLYLRDQHFLEPHLYDFYNKSLIMGVDAHDNGLSRPEIGVSSFSQVVSNFLPIAYDTSSDEMREAFFKAVDFVVGHLDRLRQRYDYTLQCQSMVKQAMRETNSYMIFEQSIPWMDNFFDLGGEYHPAEFVIMPSGSHWKLRGIPPSMFERMKVRRPLPESWAGLHEEELKKVSGIKGAIFCHKGRFISIWETKEDAIKALHLALKRDH